jgi:translation initiation factor 2B subunit (eIF-2B alpha/beta/delta family)
MFKVKGIIEINDEEEDIENKLYDAIPSSLIDSK